MKYSFFYSIFDLTKVFFRTHLRPDFRACFQTFYKLSNSFHIFFIVCSHHLIPHNYKDRQRHIPNQYIVSILSVCSFSFHLSIYHTISSMYSILVFFPISYVKVSRHAYIKGDEIKISNHPILDSSDVFCVQGD